MVSIRAAAICLSGVAIAGCAASPPTREIAEAERAVQAASHAVTPGTTAELRRAAQKLALAHRWAAASDFRPARWLAEQAQVDAELAVALIAVEMARMQARAR